MITIKTYQDLINVGENERDRIEFILQAINEHKKTDLYTTAQDAEMYYRHLNPTIMRAQKIVYNALGLAKADNWSPSHKIPSNYFFYFITQEVQYLLGNGVSFSGKNTKERLGVDFDNVVQKAATNALLGGVSFGFWDKDHLEQFSVLEFVPLYDEENGALKAGIRFWQVASDKPLRATLYEGNGFTEYIKRNGEDAEVLQERRAYSSTQLYTDAEGVFAIYDGASYPSFPIKPMFNVSRQSALVGGREIIDAYDLMASELVNNVDQAGLIYWVVRNAGGMDDLDDQKLIQRIKTLHVVHADGDQEISPHQINIPFEASDVTLKRLRTQLFDDFMALDVKDIASGATTATQIKAAYEPLNSKTDLFEYQVTDFILSLLKLLGIEDKPTYTRSVIVNQQETIQNLVTAGEFLPAEYITKKVLEIMGDGDKIDDILNQLIEDEAARFENQPQEETEETANEN